MRLIRVLNNGSYLPLRRLAIVLLSLKSVQQAVEFTLGWLYNLLLGLMERRLALA